MNHGPRAGVRTRTGITCPVAPKATASSNSATRGLWLLPRQLSIPPKMCMLKKTRGYAGDAPLRLSANGAFTTATENVGAFAIARCTMTTMGHLLLSEPFGRELEKTLRSTNGITFGWSRLLLSHMCQRLLLLACWFCGLGLTFCVIIGITFQASTAR